MGIHIAEVANLTPEQSHGIVTDYGPNLTVDELTAAVRGAEGDHHEKQFHKYTEEMFATGRSQALPLNDMVRLHVAGIPDTYDIDKRSADWQGSIEAAAQPHIERVEEIMAALKPGVLAVKIEGVGFNLDMTSIHNQAQNVQVGHISEQPLAVALPQSGQDPLGYAPYVGVRVGVANVPENNPMSVRIGELLHATVLDAPEIESTHLSRHGADYLSVYGALLVGNAAVEGLVELLRNEKDGPNDWATLKREENYAALVLKVVADRARYIIEHGKPAEPAIDFPATLAS